MTSNRTTEVNILVDADSCPFKEEIFELASQFNIEAIFFTSLCHHSSSKRGQYILVDNISQAVDMAIVNKMKPKDIIVTQDFGLAALALGKKGYAISTRGMIYEEETIDGLLFHRDIEAKIRRSGGKTKGPSKLSPADRENFVQNLKQLISRALLDTSSLQ